MAFKFNKLFVKDSDLNRVQSNVDASLKTIETLPWMGGVIIDGVLLVSGVDNRVDHGLGRDPTGFIVLDKQATCDIWRSTTSNSLASLTLLLRSSANVTIKLWVF